MAQKAYYVGPAKLIYPHLSKPDTAFKKNEFSVRAEANMTPKLQEVLSQIEAVIKQKYAETVAEEARKPQAKRKQVITRLPYEVDLGADDLVTFKRIKSTLHTLVDGWKPAVVDKDKNPITTEVGSGSTGIVKFECRAYAQVESTQICIGATLNLVAVMVTDLVAPSASGLNFDAGSDEVGF